MDSTDSYERTNNTYGLLDVMERLGQPHDCQLLNKNLLHKFSELH